MKLIKQKNRSDCGIAAIAMLTHNSYAAVRKQWAQPLRNGMEVDEVTYLFGQFVDWKRSIIRKPITADAWATKHPQKMALLFVENGAIGFDLCLHVVAAIDGKVLNPSGDDGCQRKVVRAIEIVSFHALGA
jgi:hypothetical protein